MKTGRINVTLIMFLILVPIICFGLFQLVQSTYRLLLNWPDFNLFRTDWPQEKMFLLGTTSINWPKNPTDPLINEMVLEIKRHILNQFQ